MAKKRKTPRQTHGYGSPPVQTFSLPPGCVLVWSKRIYIPHPYDDNGHPVLMSPDGQAVSKNRGLKPGEVSFILR